MIWYPRGTFTSHLCRQKWPLRILVLVYASFHVAPGHRRRGRRAFYGRLDNKKIVGSSQGARSALARACVYVSIASCTSITCMQRGTAEEKKGKCNSLEHVAELVTFWNVRACGTVLLFSLTWWVTWRIIVAVPAG